MENTTKTNPHTPIKGKYHVSNQTNTSCSMDISSYILSSASTLDVISQIVRIPKTRFFDEVMMLEDVNIRSLRQFRCLRGILFIHSLSVPFFPPSDESYLTTEFCIDKFQSTLSEFSSCNNTVRLNKMDWIREIIQNCIVCKYIC